jgi:hypothetical protein
MLANLNEEEKYPPNFYQLNLGMRFNERHSLSIEFINWDYYAPLGIPYGSEMGREENNFPGHINSKGAGFAYQYFIDTGWYLAQHFQWMEQTFFNENDERIGKGRQLFMTTRFGYQFNFFNKSFFIEPNLAITYWPINTNLPQNFEQKEEQWNNYFLFEPGLHMGIYF